MNPDMLVLLRGLDPARQMPKTTPEEREALLDRILALPIASTHRMKALARRRVVLAVVLSAGLVVVAASAVTATVLLHRLSPGPSPFINAKQWEAEYWAWTHKLTLPAGEHWAGIHIAANVGSSRGAGAMDAVTEALGRWALAWEKAAKAGDVQAAQAAEAEVTQLRALIPTVSGANDNMLGFEPGLGASLDAAIAAAKKGDFESLRYQARQFVPGLIKEVYVPPLLDLDNWVGTDTNDGFLLKVTPDEAWTEYATALRAAGTPPGLDLAAARRWTTYNLYFGMTFDSGFSDVFARWWVAWVAAGKAGDHAQAAAAKTATERLFALLPWTSAKDSRSVTNTLEPKALADLERRFAEAKRGDMSGVEQWVKLWRAHQAADAAFVRAYFGK